MSIIVGLTGGYHTGKSTVARFFKEDGAGIIDLDELAHKALCVSSAPFKNVIKEFGRDILVGKQIDRHRLARKVFGNKKRLEKLNALIHPFVIREMVRRIRSLRKKYCYVVVEAPLLFEARLENYFDYIVVVAAGKKQQIERAKHATRLTRADIVKRIGSQYALSRKVIHADFVVDNNGSKATARTQVRAIIKQLRGSNRGNIL